MSLEATSFGFEEFLLDGKQKVLLRDGKPLPITPKAFQLLQILVENHGHLIDRNELINRVWADSFVEEGNLTFTIRLLRKTLGDDKQKPRFIETVPKRGYRFIAEVKEFSQQPETPTEVEEHHSVKKTAAPLPENKSNRQRFLLAVIALMFLLSAAAGLGSWYTRSTSFAANVPVLSAPFALQKLSTNGKVRCAAISPDGKKIIYVSGAFTEKQSVWIRELESGSNTEIIPPSDYIYFGLKFSPDGNFIYFNRSSKSNPQQDIYRVSVFGGIPNKILDNTEGWMSISPDGKQISFVRCPHRADENCSLLVADAGGKNEKKLASRAFPMRIGDNQFSPDGKKIAFAAGQSMNAANEFGLMEINLESGAERELTKEKFFNIKRLTWLPENGGLLITAARIPTKQFLIWQVFPASGLVEPLTKDSENYNELSLDKDGTSLVATQTFQDFRLVVLSRDNLFSPRILADASRAAFAPDGKILFASLMSGNDEIWSINADGSEQRQLTNDPADDSAPVVSGGDGAIFFASNRTGNSETWRMNPDGSNPIRITSNQPGTPIFVSPDGNWLYYHHSLNKTLWKIPTGGGEGQLVLNKFAHHFAFSPDGRQVAFLENRDDEKFIEIVSIFDGQTAKSIKISDQKNVVNEICWMPDGAGIVYVAAEDNQNFALRLQPVSGETSKKIADLGNEQVNSFVISPDGSKFAVVKGGWRHDAVLLKGLR